MNKAELIQTIATKSKCPKSTAELFLNSTIDAIVKAISQGEDVKIVGFGTFCRAERKPKTGRNPKTGQTYKIPTTRVPRFKPGKEFKDLVK